MGGNSYDYAERSVRAVSSGYHTKASKDIFTQASKREIHESMKPSGALLRESRDSDVHPRSVPVIMGLDVTGSMGQLPLYLVRDGLPTMVSQIIQKGVADPAILFLGIGDHEYDRAPLQVGQFESGDAELDLWLTRTWLEEGGGRNAGESYLLAWYFAAMHTVTDAWEKRKEKGFIFTIGDEPCLKNLPGSVINALMGISQAKSYRAEELLELASERYHIFHLNMSQGHHGNRSVPGWKAMIGQNLIEVHDYNDVARIVSDIIASNVNITSNPVLVETKKTSEPEVVKEQPQEPAYWKK
jgi:hypothetical protein